MGFFSKLFGRKPQKVIEHEFSQRDIDIVAQSAFRIAEVLNESLKISKESNNIDTKTSRLDVAKQKLQEAKDISEKYPFIKLEKLDEVEKEIVSIENELESFKSSVIIPEDFSKHGEVDGKHYTGYVECVKQLKKEKRHSEAITLLQTLVKATEKESKESGFGVAPWYYEQLAIIYRKEKMYKEEVKILEQYQSQRKAPGAKPEKLKERLTKARELLSKHMA